MTNPTVGPDGQLIGGKCQDCDLYFKPGGPHLSAIHCRNELKAYAKFLDGVVASQKAKLDNLRNFGRICWMMISKLPNRTLVVTQQDFESVPKTSGLAMSPGTDKGSITILAVDQMIKPEVK